MRSIEAFLNKITKRVGDKYYFENLESETRTSARNMLLEVITNAPDNRVKKTELSKEILKGLKVKKVKGVTEKEVQTLIN